MPAGSEASDNKNWVDWMTMAASLASLLVTTTIGVLSYRIDSKTKLFESRGYLDVDYVGVDLLNFCPGDDPGKVTYNDPSAATPEVDVAYNLNRGFVKNAAWREASARIDRYCKEIGPYGDKGGILDQKKVEMYRNRKVLGYSLVYMIVRSQQSLFSISPVFRADFIKSENGRNIWDYAKLRGRSEEIPLGPVRKGEPVMMAVAIIHEFKLDSPNVIIPRSVEWISPVNQSRAVLPVDFLVQGDYWKSKQQGVTVSGGDLTDM